MDQIAKSIQNDQSIEEPSVKREIRRIILTTFSLKKPLSHMEFIVLLFSGIISITMINSVIETQRKMGNQNLETLILVAGSLFIFGVLLLNGYKRMKVIGFPFLFRLILFVPVVNILALMVLSFFKTSEEKEMYNNLKATWDSIKKESKKKKKERQ